MRGTNETFWGELKKGSVDPHFSRAPPLDRRDSLFICEKLLFEKKKLELPLILFILKGK